MKKLLTAGFLSCVGFCVYSQATIPDGVRAQNSLTQMFGKFGTGSSQTVQDLPVRSSVVGTTYLFDNWLVGSILLTNGNGVISNREIKYDLQARFFEIKVDSVIKVLPSNRVDGFSVSIPGEGTKYFLNAESYKLDGVPIIGFLEIVQEGKVSLFKRVTLYLKKPNYNVAMAVGDKDHQYLKKKQYVFGTDRNLFMVSKSNKKFIQKIEELTREQVSEYVDERGLSCKKEEDLKRILQFIEKEGA